MNIPTAAQLKEQLKTTSPLTHDMLEVERAVHSLIQGIAHRKFVTVDGISDQWVYVPSPCLSSAAITQLQTLGYEYIATYKYVCGEEFVNYAIRMKPETDCNSITGFTTCPTCATCACSTTVNTIHPVTPNRPIVSKIPSKPLKTRNTIPLEDSRPILLQTLPPVGLENPFLSQLAQPQQLEKILQTQIEQHTQLPILMEDNSDDDLESKRPRKTARVSTE